MALTIALLIGSFAFANHQTIDAQIQLDWSLNGTLEDPIQALTLDQVISQDMKQQWQGAPVSTSFSFISWLMT